MKCPDIENLITDYQENRLPLAQRLEVEQHLGECAACRGFARQLCALDEALTASIKIPALPAGFEANLRRKLESTPVVLSDVQRLARKQQLQAEFEAGMARIVSPRFRISGLLNGLSWPVLTTVAAWAIWEILPEWHSQSLFGLDLNLLPWLVVAAVFLATGLREAPPGKWIFSR